MPSNKSKPIMTQDLRFNTPAPEFPRDSEAYRRAKIQREEAEARDLKKNQKELAKLEEKSQQYKKMHGTVGKEVCNILAHIDAPVAAIFVAIVNAVRQSYRKDQIKELKSSVMARLSDDSKSEIRELLSGKNASDSAKLIIEAHTKANAPTAIPEQKVAYTELKEQFGKLDKTKQEEIQSEINKDPNASPALKQDVQDEIQAAEERETSGQHAAPAPAP